MRGRARIRAAALGFSLIQACAGAHDVLDDVNGGAAGSAAAGGNHTSTGTPGAACFRPGGRRRRGGRQRARPQGPAPTWLTSPWS